MASQSEAQQPLVGLLRSQITISTLEIPVNSYLLTMPLKTTDDLGELNALRLALADYHGGWRALIPLGSTNPSSTSCSVLMFDTEGDWVVAFILQDNHGEGRQETWNQRIEKMVKIMLRNVKWNDRQMIPINSNYDTATPLPDGFERSIGESDITQIKKWMYKTSVNINKALIDDSVNGIHEILGSGNMNLKFSGYNIVSHWIEKHGLDQFVPAIRR